MSFRLQGISFNQKIRTISIGLKIWFSSKVIGINRSARRIINLPDPARQAFNPIPHLTGMPAWRYLTGGLSKSNTSVQAIKVKFLGGAKLCWKIREVRIKRSSRMLRNLVSGARSEGGGNGVWLHLWLCPQSTGVLCISGSGGSYDFRVGTVSVS